MNNSLHLKLSRTAKILSAAIACLFAISFAGCSSFEKETPIPTKQNVDASKYMGTWYEIARFPNSFEGSLKDCTAEYTLVGDTGKVLIVNKGKDAFGNVKEQVGTGYIPNPAEFSKLRITFFWPFYYDYYILELADDYSWALVGNKNMKYLWILSRKPELPQLTINEILKLAEKRGYIVSQFVYNKNLQ